jgi:glycosyltransferase involved in cell wall biosynthesis
MQQKIKVLECIRQGQIGGGESHLLSLVENLDKSVFDPLVLSFTDGPMIERLQDMQVPTKIIPTTRPFDVTKWKTVRNFIREQQVDLIHAHGTRANSNVLWAAKSLGIPVIYTVHGWSFHPDQRSFVRKIRILGERYLTDRSDVNISVSASNQQTGKENLGRFTSVVINNGIDLQKFDPTRAYKDIRSQLGIAANDLLVLFIARFTAHKQPLALIKAFAQAAAQLPHLHLLLVGDGDQKEEAVRLIDQLQLQDRITLEKFRQDVPDVLAAADIFVLPSLWEGLPIGLLEAMAMGKAIIASRVDGTKEIIEHGVNGWLVDTEDLVNQLRDALVQLAGDPAKRERFSLQAMDTVRQRFNAADMTRRIENIYKEVLAKKTAGQ